MYYCTSAIYIPGCTPDKQLRIRLATAGEEKSEMQPKTLDQGGEVKFGIIMNFYNISVLYLYVIFNPKQIQTVGQKLRKNTNL